MAARAAEAGRAVEAARIAEVFGAAEANSLLSLQRNLSVIVNRQGDVVMRWLAVSNDIRAQMYRLVVPAHPKIVRMIRGQILDIRMRAIFVEMFGTYGGIRFGKTILGSGSRLMPDLYFPRLFGRSVIVEVGSYSKIKTIGKYYGLSDDLIILIPVNWMR